MIPAAPVKRKFYMTGGRTEDARGFRDDCTVPPIVCYGTDRLDALANSGITVWEAEDYERIRERFKEDCKKAAAERP